MNYLEGYRIRMELINVDIRILNVDSRWFFGYFYFQETVEVRRDYSIDLCLGGRII